MKTLQEIWNRLPTKSDKGNVHSYLPIYEEVLSPYRHTASNVLEIGLFNGASLPIWDEYFTSAAIHGIDCDEQPHGGLADLRPSIASFKYNIVIGNAESNEDIAKHFAGMKFDVIIEDAGHDLAQQIKIYKTLKPYMAKGGIYIIEDVQDIDSTISIFENLDHEKDVRILDLRESKKRYDDVLVILTDKK